MNPTRRRSLRCPGILLAAALAACSPTLAGRTLFQREGGAIQTSLRQDAKRQVPSIADDQMAVGVINDPRGKRNLTYGPGILHVQRGRKVSWVSWDGSFTMALKPRLDGRRQRWPFQEPENTTLTSAGKPELQSLTLTVAPDAAPETYSFQVRLMVADPGKPAEILETINDENCPSIIIDLF